MIFADRQATTRAPRERSRLRSASVTTLDPAVALSTCETALRELMAYSFGEAFGPNWLNRVTTDQQRQVWQERAAEEAATRTSRGVFQPECTA